MKPIICHCFIFLFICFYSIELLSQQKDNSSTANYIDFQIDDPNNDINFILINPDTTKVKPVFIFLQGSLPYPLVVEYTDGSSKFVLLGFNYEDLADKYHFVMISHPTMPNKVLQSKLSKSGRYVPNPEKPEIMFSDYNKANYQGNHINRTNKVVDFLYSKSWTTKTQFVIMGHSQGASVALKTANSNKKITHLIFSSSSPFGRTFGSLRRIRQNERNGKLTAEQAQSSIEGRYNYYRSVCEDNGNDTITLGDTYKTTYSFTDPLLDDFLDVDVPLLITYGSKDFGSLDLDYIPLLLEREQKNNYTVKVYPGLGHNFEEKDENGKSDWNKMHWDTTINDIIDWIDKSNE